MITKLFAFDTEIEYKNMNKNGLHAHSIFLDIRQKKNYAVILAEVIFIDFIE